MLASLCGEASQEQSPGGTTALRTPAQEHGISESLSEVISGVLFWAWKPKMWKVERRRERQTHSGYGWSLLEYPDPAPSPVSHKRQSWGLCKHILKPRQVSSNNADELNQRHAYISGSIGQNLSQIF